MFLALWPPATVVSELADALPQCFAELRWQSVQRWHITIAFLGERSPDKELRRLDRLDVPRADLVRLEGSGTFGTVLWVGVDGGDWLTQLAHACQTVFDPQDRRFRAHLTVARARSAAGHRQLAGARSALAGFQSTTWLPDQLTLVLSRTGPKPSYEVIGRKPLTGT